MQILFNLTVLLVILFDNNTVKGQESLPLHHKTYGIILSVQWVDMT